MTVNGLLVAVRDQGRLEEAEKLARELVSIRRRVYGEDDRYRFYGPTTQHESTSPLSSVSHHLPLRPAPPRHTACTTGAQP